MLAFRRFVRLFVHLSRQMDDKVLIKQATFYCKTPIKCLRRKHCIKSCEPKMGQTF